MMRVLPSVCMVHPWKSLPFSRDVVRELGRFGYGFGSWQAKLLVGNNKQAPRQAKGLVRMGVCRGDGCHQLDSLFHAISEVPWIIHVSADPLIGFGPNDYHISEATEPYIQESSGENGSLNDLEYDDVTIGIALSSPLFTQEREEDASCRRAYPSHDEGLSSSQSSSVGHRTVRPVVEQFDSQIPNVR